MKITIEINKHFHAGNFAGFLTWIEANGVSVYSTLIEPAATPEQITQLIAETILPQIQKETK